MSGDAVKKKAENLSLAPKSRYVVLQKLILYGSFDRPVSSGEVALRIKEKFGRKWGTNHVQTYMRKFMDADVIHAVKPPKGTRNFWVLASVSRDDALKQLGKSRKIKEIEEDLFSSDLVNALKKDFEGELAELNDNFGRNGNCTAFLLRKTLEKLIIIVFDKNGMQHLLEDTGRAGGKA